MILAYDKLGFIMSASTSIEGRKNGLIGHHCYSLSAAAKVVDYRLVKLRNPWGHFEWDGKWSDDSELWKQHPAVAKACRYTGPADDGQFWMAFEDFLEHFDSIDVVSGVAPRRASKTSLPPQVLKRTDDLHEVYLDLHEEWPVCGPCRGCLGGCACYYCACQGARKLCCGKDYERDAPRPRGNDAPSRLEQRCLDARREVASPRRTT